MSSGAVQVRSVGDVAGLLERGEVYAAAEAGWALLRESSAERAVRNVVAEALERLGLGGLGHWVREGAGQAGTGGRARRGAIPWASGARRFNANLALLHERDAGLALAVRTEWFRHRPRLELFGCADGNYQVLLRDPHGPGVWLGGLRDHRGEIEGVHWPQEGYERTNGGVIVGVHFGWLIDRLYRETHHVFLEFSCLMHWVVFHPVEMAVAMHLHDWADLLNDPRVHVYGGEEGLMRLREVLTTDVRYPVPTWRIVLPHWFSAPVGRVDAVLREVSEGRARAAARGYESLCRRYAGRDAAYWAARFTQPGGEPLRVLGFVSRHSTFIRRSMERSLEALEALGCRCRLATESEPYFLGHTMGEAHAVQEEFEPDLVFMIDNYRGQTTEFVPPDVPFVMWIQDRLGRLFCRSAGEKHGTLDFVMGYGREECVGEYGYPADGFAACDVPTALHLAERLPEEECAPYACDVSFVSTASKSPENLRDEWLERCRGDAGVLIKALYEEVRQWLDDDAYLTDPHAVVDDVARRVGIDLRDGRLREELASGYVFRMYDWGWRQQVLRWVADWARRTGRRFHLYGRGWEQFEALAEFARGHLWEAREVQAAIQASTINLQVFPLTVLHQRSYDVLAAGGFLLARRTAADFFNDDVRQLRAVVEREGVEALRAPQHETLRRRLKRRYRRFDEWLEWLAGDPAGRLPKLRPDCLVDRVPVLREVAFDDPASLEEKLEEFLADAERRERIRAALCEGLAGGATYESRMRDMLAFVSERLRLRARYGGPGEDVGPRAVEPHRARVLILPARFPDAFEGFDEAVNRPIAALEQVWAGWSEQAVVEQEATDIRADSREAYRLLDAHTPDLVVGFDRVLVTHPVLPRLRHVCVAINVGPAPVTIPDAPGCRLVTFRNLRLAARSDRASQAAWRGGADERHASFWWPVDTLAHRQEAADAAYDVTLRIDSLVPASALLERQLGAARKRGAPVARVLEAVVRNLSALEDPWATTPAGMDLVLEDLQRTLGEPGPEAPLWRSVRIGVLALVAEALAEERWLAALLERAEARGWRVCIEATQSWRAIVGDRGRWMPLRPFDQPAPPARVHVSFAAGSATPAHDLVRLLEGVPVVIWRGPTYEFRTVCRAALRGERVRAPWWARFAAGAGQADRWGVPIAVHAAEETTFDLLPGLAEMSFQRIEELESRIEACLGESPARPDVEDLSGTLREQASTGAVLREITRWAMG